VYGNILEGVFSCGGTFNPFGKMHGAPQDSERMMGNLGNVTVGTDGKCTVHIDDNQVKLIRPHSVIGRSIVIYAGEDDCGRGAHELSLETGNSGAQIAAGVIGISK
jgi:Cu-Zn family superoxide dismutase